MRAKFKVGKAEREGKTGYIPSLDGWRAVAILLVILAHNHILRAGALNDRWLYERGDRGVGIFFALSGILICDRLLREERRFGSISLRSFYTRRAFRIQPAALAYLFVCAAIAGIGRIPSMWPGIVAAMLMVRNYWPHDLGWDTAHFWSLSVEEHFYLFLPGFLVLCRRHRLRILISLVIGLEIWRFVLFEVIWRSIPGEYVYSRTDLVVDGILLGCIVTVALTKSDILRFAKSHLHPWIGFVYTAVVFARLELHHSRFDHVLLISVYPILIASTMLHPGSWTTRFLELAPVRFIGRISFSLYLWQELFFHRYETPATHSFQSHVIFCWGGVFGCAIASYYLIEQPMVRYGHRIAKKFDLEKPERGQSVGSADIARVE
jgi:peptidoglycan/LPS O-acetylase OafA/YrhL